jgi:hypothetical protein
MLRIDVTTLLSQDDIDSDIKLENYSMLLDLRVDIIQLISNSIVSPMALSQWSILTSLDGGELMAQ